MDLLIHDNLHWSAVPDDKHTVTSHHKSCHSNRQCNLADWQLATLKAKISKLAEEAVYTLSDQNGTHISTCSYTWQMLSGQGKEEMPLF